MIQLKSQLKKFGLIFVAMLIGAFQSQAAKTHLNMGMVLGPPHLDPTAVSYTRLTLPTTTLV